LKNSFLLISPDHHLTFNLIEPTRRYISNSVPMVLFYRMTESTIHRKEKSLLPSIAVFEIVKGISALAAGAGLLSLAHHDLKFMAYAIIGHFHIDPESHYPQLLIT
jgi:hypothetical protein